jgi:hypothetical protein
MPRVIGARVPRATASYVSRMTAAGILEFGTQRGLARRMGVHENSIRSWLHGRAIPRADAFVWLQNRYGHVTETDY